MIEQSESEIGRKIMVALSKELEALFNRKAPQIQQIVGELFSTIIYNSDEWTALMIGQVKYELGITNAAGRLTDIINEMIKSIKIDIHKITFAGDIFTPGISIFAVKSDYSNLLSLDSASYQYLSKINKSRGGPKQQLTAKQRRIIARKQSSKNVGELKTIEWLRWLLTEGSQPIVLNYHFVPGSFPSSRTGGGLMFSGGDWSMPPEHAGTMNDNFITRAIAKLQPKFREEITKCLTSP